MKHSQEREIHSYNRAAFICFLCIAACLFFDIRTYILAGRIIFDFDFFSSLLLYTVLTILAIRSIRKGKKLKESHEIQ